MELSKQDRESFLRRLGAVVEARSDSDESQLSSDSVSFSEKWSDEDIQMAIYMGF